MVSRVLRTIPIPSIPVVSYRNLGHIPRGHPGMVYFANSTAKRERRLQKKINRTWNGF